MLRYWPEARERSAPADDQGMSAVPHRTLDRGRLGVIARSLEGFEGLNPNAAELLVFFPKGVKGSRGQD